MVDEDPDRADGSHTSEELIEIGRELAARVTTASRFEAEGGRMVNAAHVPYVHGLTIHAIRLAEVVYDLYERGAELQAVPTARAAYEAALTAVWLSEGKEAVLAAFNEHVRQRKNLQVSMDSSPTFGPMSKDRPLAESQAETFDVLDDAARQARHFEQLCKSLVPGGADAYVIYRGMSSYAHPTAPVVDEYLDESASAENGLPPRLLMQSKPFDGGAFLFMVVASTVWAARALDNMNRNRPHRNYLRGVARELKIADVLRMSPEAVDREAAAERARRREAWRGPRKRSRRSER